MLMWKSFKFQRKFGAIGQNLIKISLNILGFKYNHFYPEYHKYSMKGCGAYKHFLMWLLFQDDPCFLLIKDGQLSNGLKSSLLITVKWNLVFSSAVSSNFLIRIHIPLCLFESLNSHFKYILGFALELIQGFRVIKQIV